MEVGSVLIRFGSDAASIAWLDFFLLLFCPLGAWLGTSVASAIDRKKLYKDVPERWYSLQQELIEQGETVDESIRTKVHEEYISYIDSQYRISQMGNKKIAMGLGIVISLYFFGAITEDLTSLSRVVGLSIVLGYQAPNLWRLQEKAINKIAEKQYKSIVSSAQIAKNRMSEINNEKF